MAQVRLATRVALSISVLALLSGFVSAADNRLQVVSFTSKGCQPCRAMQPVLEQLARDGWSMRQVDVQEHPEFIQPFKVESLPTIVVMQDRQEVDRIVGTLGYEKLVARLEQASKSREAEAPRFREPDLTREPPIVRGQSPQPEPNMLAMNSARGGDQEMVDFASPRSTPARPASSTVTPQSTTPARPMISSDDRAQRATVRIKIEDASTIAYGTGTVINMHNDQALVLTCGHIFRGIGKDAQLSVDLFDRGRTINVAAHAVSYSIDKEGDIGLIEFRSPLPIVPVPIAKQLPAVGERAFSFGCDQGADPTRRDTQIKQINRFLGPANIEIVGAPVLGRSGGGLFNERGQLVGVCNAADNEDDEGIYASLPVIHQHIAALKLEDLPQDDVPNVDPRAAQVQLASTSARPNNQSANRDDYWPDQKFNQTPAPVTPTASTQLRCVIRDASGKETAVTIDRPSDELLAMLKSQAR